MVGGELRDVERAARKAALSRERLKKAIREAHGRGLSLRAIAEKANVSHEQVRRIVNPPEPCVPARASTRGR